MRGKKGDLLRKYLHGRRFGTSLLISFEKLRVMKQTGRTNSAQAGDFGAQTCGQTSTAVHFLHSN